MFVHVGIMHLMMNLIIQIFLGIALELVHHWWRVALVYLAGVLAGSMGTSLTSPRIFLAGASGGVYALITAHIATIIMVSPKKCAENKPFLKIRFPFTELLGNGVCNCAAACIPRVLLHRSGHVSVSASD